VDEALRELAEATAYIKKQEADMNEELEKVRNKYASSSEFSSKKIMAIETDIKLFCEERKKEFDVARSRKLQHGVVGFRFGKFALKAMAKEWTKEKILDRVEKIFGKVFIINNPKIDAEKIIKQATGKVKILTAEDLAGVGFRIEQKEDFYCEAIWEELVAQAPAAEQLQK
jgi:phage host-nuclease inhibitor protein Gam